MHRAIVALCSATLLVTMLVPGAVAGTPGSSAPLRAVIDMEVATTGCPAPPVAVPYPDECWLGRIEGDIDGLAAFWGTDQTFDVGAAHHFFEVFVILPDSGGWIRGTDRGIVPPTLRFMALGWVTSASPEWAHLVGSKYFESGAVVVGPDSMTANDTRVFIARAHGG
jgi:hypothetical protein